MKQKGGAMSEQENIWQKYKRDQLNQEFVSTAAKSEPHAQAKEHSLLDLCLDWGRRKAGGEGVSYGDWVLSEEILLLAW